jgi:hypothetical protein
MTCTYSLGYLLNPFYEGRDTYQIDSFSLCRDQEKDCVENVKIKGRSITIRMPYGTSVKKLVAYFKYQGAKVYIGKTEQISGKTMNDFTYPVVYRVQARSGSSAEYYVKVITAPEKTICAFFLTGCETFNSRLDGVIDQNKKTISVMLSPWTVGECRRAGRKLKAHFIYSGSSIIGPEEDDFTSPVVYTVKAQDGSSVNYTVMVTIVPERTIYEFMIDTYNPFHDPPRYNCENNVFSDYCASISLPDTAYRGHIDQINKLITVNLPNRDGIDVKKLRASFKITSGSVYVGKAWQISGERVNDFACPVIYRVKDEHAVFSDYTVKVNVIPEKTLSEFFLSECFDYCEKYYGVIDEKTKTISVMLPDDKKGKALSSLKANFTYSGSSVFVDKNKQISGITENDFSSPVVYTVQAKDGSLANYTVTVAFQTDARKI